MSELLQYARNVLAAQPFSQLLGAEVASITSGEVVLHLPLQHAHTQQHGMAHGGVISYLADNALTFAGGSVLGDAVTGEFKINYLRPARGEALQARASVVNAGKASAVCQCVVEAIDGEQSKPIALAQGTIVRVGKGD